MNVNSHWNCIHFTPYKLTTNTFVPMNELGYLFRSLFKLHCFYGVSFLARLFLILYFILKAPKLECGSHLRFFVSTYRAAGAIGRKWRHRHRGPDVTLLQRVSVLGECTSMCLQQLWNNVTSLCFKLQLRILAVLLSSFPFIKLYGCREKIPDNVWFVFNLIF